MTCLGNFKRSTSPRKTSEIPNSMSGSLSMLDDQNKRLGSKSKLVKINIDLIWVFAFTVKNNCLIAKIDGPG